jgi:prepilin-type N-terminal cleavage/methylation domain-containing protein
MTLLPRSPTSSPLRGFTLIELLVVLAILALAVAITGPRLLGMLTPDPARDLPQQLQDKIDRMRSDAIYKSQVEFAVIDYLDNNLTVDGVPWVPPSGWEFAPPREGDLPADEPTPVVQDPDRIGLEFAPDGTAKSAHFILHSTKDENGWIFDVSAMTGRVSHRPLHPAAAS